MKNKLPQILFSIARRIDLSISKHVKVKNSQCHWYCKPGARLADALRIIGNKIWKDVK
jgi:hypothetical protein